MDPDLDLDLTCGSLPSFSVGIRCSPEEDAHPLPVPRPLADLPAGLVVFGGVPGGIQLLLLPQEGAKSFAVVVTFYGLSKGPHLRLSPLRVIRPDPGFRLYGLRLVAGRISYPPLPAAFKSREGGTSPPSSPGNDHL